MTPQNYIEQQDLKSFEKIERLLKEMPLFINLFVEAKKGKMTSKTILGYIYDFNKFFSWTKSNVFDNKKNIKDLSIADLELISDEDINRYVIYLQTDKNNFNSNISIRRKISSLSSLYSFLCKQGYIDDNPCRYVEYPDFIIPDSTCLTNEQTNLLLSQIANSDDVYSNRQISYINKTRTRDYTIISLLLMTGVRVTECVALDVNSIDFQNKTLSVRRSNVDIKLPLADTILAILSEYKKTRDEINTESNAMFISMQGNRLCVQAVEDMIKKHSELIGLPFTLTPKTFRHTFAVRMFETSASIDLVNSYLGKRRVEEIRILMNHLTKEQKKKVYDTLNQMF